MQVALDCHSSLTTLLVLPLNPLQSSLHSTRVILLIQEINSFSALNPPMTSDCTQYKSQNPFVDLESPSRSGCHYYSDMISYHSTFVHSTPTILVSLLYLEHARHAPTSGPLHLLFFRSGTPFPRYSCMVFFFTFFMGFSLVSTLLKIAATPDLHMPGT